MKKIILLTDYKGHFGTKYIAKPYRSGMNKHLIKDCFEKRGFEAEFRPLANLDFQDPELKEAIILYTSAEDGEVHYKDYIEDIILGLQHLGAKIIPDFYHLRAHHNKIFMEILRQTSLSADSGDPGSCFFGSIKEITDSLPDIPEEIVLKPAAGSLSKGVRLARNHSSLVKEARRIMKSKNTRKDLWDIGRSMKHKGYIRESQYRRKILLQSFIKDLKKDWKILIYWDKYYVLTRSVKKNDFRASGSGIFKHDRELPDGLLTFSEYIFNQFDVPFLSLDVGYDGETFFLFEFQTVLFGTYTIDHSNFYFTRKDNQWVINEGASILEQEFVNSVTNYVDEKYA